MSFLSSSTFPSILSQTGLSVKDNSFYYNLNETRKNLIIGENGAGKTRLLKAIERYYDKNPDENNVLLFPVYCSELDISHDETKDKSSDEPPDNDIIEGLIYELPPQKDTLKINRRTFLKLTRQIMMEEKDQRKKKLDLINNNLIVFLKKRLIIETTSGKDNLMITRNKDDDKETVPLVQEWNFLSPGERIIIILLLLIQYLEHPAESVENKNIVVLLDEPESHLHPKVMLEIIKRLLKYFSKKNDNEQIYRRIFISSHSVFLMPYFEFEEQIYMKNGDISRKNSSLHIDLYNDLVGKEPSLLDFLGLVHTWDYISYISECFKEPEQVERTNKNDPQSVNLLNKVIFSMIEERRTISVLDYGCGKTARIGKNIAEYYKSTGRTDILKNKVKYFAYDKYDLEKLNQNIDDIPFLAEKITSYAGLKEKSNTFDLILLFNVLHEIDVSNWEEEINFLLDLLKDDGSLVFSERKILSIGERPLGKTGFIVFSEKEIKKLFNNESVKIIPQENDNIVIAAIEKKHCSQKVARENIMESLSELEKNTEEKIFSVLDLNEALSPRNYAFYCQQYFNSAHAVKLLSENKKVPTGDELKKYNYAMIDRITDKNYRRRMLIARAKIDDPIGDECRREVDNYNMENKYV